MTNFFPAILLLTFPLFSSPVLAQSAAPAEISSSDSTTFVACLKNLRKETRDRGVSATTFDTYTHGLSPDMSILPLLDYQPEFKTPVWDYMAALVDEQRISDGKAMMQQWRETLKQVEAQYGVDSATVVAVWGVESDYGRNFGKRPLVTSLATLSCFGRRQTYFRGEFFATLKILEQGHVVPESLRGSWAGAFGHTQFMPSTFMRIAVDFDGDGKRDLINSVPDALASTANYLVKSGWRNTQPWGYEVRIPSGLDVSNTGRRNKRSIEQWQQLGIKRTDGSPLSASSDKVGLFLPAGANGPAFLVFKNFDAIYAYNAAESYALAIAHLSDRLRGNGSFVAAWPTDDPGLSRAERIELQTQLLSRGYDIGEADGVIGSATRKAIQDIQPELGLTPDGYAGQKLLRALRHRQ